MDKQKITNIIYDSLMNNDGEQYEKLDDDIIDGAEVDASKGLIQFEIEGKIVFLHITIEDKEEGTAYLV